MKNVFKKATAIVLSAIMFAAVPLTASADSKVTYDGNAKDFIYSNSGEMSPTDLFTDFKDLMPGDSITEKIVVDNKIDNNVKIKVYVRSLGSEEGSEDFLSQLTLTVNQTDGTNLFKAPANETAKLSDWVYLGTIYSGGKIELDVTLSIPVTLDNEFQNAIGYLDWEFKVEELPVESDDPTPPPTGDTFKTVMWITICTASVGCIFFIILFKRRKKEEEE